MIQGVGDFEKVLKTCTRMQTFEIKGVQNWVDDGKGQAITLVSAGEGSFSDGKQVFTSRVPLNCFLGREGVRGRDMVPRPSLAGGVRGFPKWP